jgi:hypothetical protein
MPGTSNFQVFNPSQNNQETDAQYAADSLRTNGAGNSAIFPSATANKILYQQSVFTSAFSIMLAQKGYTVSDASLANLAAVLANVMTAADMPPYALLASPAFSGTPTAPTPGAGDNSTRIATTAFVDGGFQPLLGFTPVQQGGGASQGANKVYLGYNPSTGGVNVQIDNNNGFGDLALRSDFGRTNQSQRFSNGGIMQWGGQSVNGSASITFPFAFPNTQVLVMCMAANGAAYYATAGNGNNSGFNAYVWNSAGTAGNSWVSWLALGS